jgi:hypothetical protein
MATQFYTLKQLKERVNSLIEQQGEDAPVAWWIYTNEDVFTIDEEGNEQYKPIEVCEKVLSGLQDYDYIHTVIVDAIDSELIANESQSQVN